MVFSSLFHSVLTMVNILNNTELSSVITVQSILWIDFFLLLKHGQFYNGPFNLIVKIINKDIDYNPKG